MYQFIDVACGFLGGTIISVEGGYRVLQHPKANRVFNRLADARWFLAVHWCDQYPTPAGILTHQGQVTFQNHAALAVGETIFLPLHCRKEIFERCLTLGSGEFSTYTTKTSSQDNQHQIEIMGIDIDPRYGRVALIRTHHSDSLAPF
ncbi:MAG: hypothetical protein AAGF93_18420 [Cyanobacteria bacterium P01_H01_bin.105]